MALFRTGLVFSLTVLIRLLVVASPFPLTGVFPEGLLLMLTLAEFVDAFLLLLPSDPLEAAP
jgi:hypothetical protein